MIFAPCKKNIFAEIDPTLPKPWTATRASFSGTPWALPASRPAIMTPRPVASSRPRDPPIVMGLPVTTLVTVWRMCME